MEQREGVRYLTWQRMTHNPEVAGSNPAPATRKAPETGPFCCRRRGCAGELLPNFCRDATHRNRSDGAARRGVGRVVACPASTRSTSRSSRSATDPSDSTDPYRPTSVALSVAGSVALSSLARLRVGRRLGVGRLRLGSGVLGERQLGEQRRSSARRAVERHGPAERLDSVLQPYKTRAASWVCPADAVVSNTDPEAAVA